MAQEQRLVVSEKIDPGRDEALEALRKRLRERIEKRKADPPTRVRPAVEPRYDEVFHEGAAWIAENG